VRPSALAFALGKSRSWITRFLNGQRQELQISDLDRIADFFGKETYQLFQPGNSFVTERRLSIRDRRTGEDRRVGHAYRAMLTTSHAIEAHRSHGKGRHADVVAAPLAEKLKRLAAAYERDLGALLTEATKSRGQNATPRGTVAGPHARRRAVRRSDSRKN
jgi:transcriptional regulator with XRE-family HTH domain